MRLTLMVAAIAMSLLIAACKEVPEGYDYGPPVTNFGQPRFANNGGA